MKKILTIIIALLLVIFLILFLNNKSFFESYIMIGKTKIKVPKYSLIKSKSINDLNYPTECCSNIVEIDSLELTITLKILLKNI